MDEYKKIDFEVGCTIEEALKKLHKHKINNVKAKGFFNDKLLLSDIDTLDSAYLKITGLSYEDYKQKEKQRHEEYLHAKVEHEAKIPELTKYWIKKGHEILSEDKWELWDKCVPIRLSDLYKGMELECCLDIISFLKENNHRFDLGKIVIENQGHSGTSFSLLCSMLKSFYEKGEEFVKYIKENN